MLPSVNYRHEYGFKTTSHQFHAISEFRLSVKRESVVIIHLEISPIPVSRDDPLRPPGEFEIVKFRNSSCLAYAVA